MTTNETTMDAARGDLLGIEAELSAKTARRAELEAQSGTLQRDVDRAKQLQGAAVARGDQGEAEAQRVRLRGLADELDGITHALPLLDAEITDLETLQKQEQRASLEADFVQAGEALTAQMQQLHALALAFYRDTFKGEIAEFHARYATFNGLSRQLDKKSPGAFHPLHQRSLNGAGAVEVLFDIFERLEAGKPMGTIPSVPRDQPLPIGDRGLGKSRVREGAIFNRGGDELGRRLSVSD